MMTGKSYTAASQTVKNLSLSVLSRMIVREETFAWWRSRLPFLIEASRFAYAKATIKDNPPLEARQA
jgi:hypothetical protein